MDILGNHYSLNTSIHTVKLVFRGGSDVILSSEKGEVNLLNSLMDSNFSDRKMDPWADKFGTRTASLTPIS